MHNEIAMYVEVKTSDMVKHLQKRIEAVMAEKETKRAAYLTAFEQWKRDLAHWAMNEAPRKINALKAPPRRDRYGNSPRMNWTSGAPEPPEPADMDGDLRELRTAVRLLAFTNQDRITIGRDEVIRLFGDGPLPFELLKKQKKTPTKAPPTRARASAPRVLRKGHR